MGYYFEVEMEPRKKIALIAHDGRKKDLLSWVKNNVDILKHHELFGTGTTGKIIEEKTGLKLNKFKSGPLGGDQQIGASIVNGIIDMMIFFWDPMEPLPHDPDVKALLRIAVLYNIPIANNFASADFLISSPLINRAYKRKIIDYEKRIKRNIEL